jgi:hypothetical protein
MHSLSVDFRKIWPAIHNGGYCQCHFNIVSDGMRSIDPVVPNAQLHQVAARVQGPDFSLGALPS